MDVAKEALTRILPGLESPGLEVGLLAYGHRRSKDCEDVELIVPPATGVTGAIAEAVGRLAPRGKTPLAASIAKAGEILQSAGDVPLRLIVLTDGLETCGGDASAAARAVAASGVDVKVQVIGLAIDDTSRGQLEAIAKSGKGEFFDARDDKALAKSFQKVKQEIVEKAEKVEAKPEPKPEPKPEAESSVLFKDDFNGEELGSDWKVLNPNEELLVVDEGNALLLSEMKNKDGIFPNTLELMKKLDGDFDLEVTLDVHFNLAGPWTGGYGSNGNPQQLRIELGQSAKRQVYVEYVNHGYSGCWLSTPILGSITKSGDVRKAGPSVNWTRGVLEHQAKLVVKITKRKHTLKAFIKRTSKLEKDEKWVELGSFRMLKFKPKLRLSVGNNWKGQPSTEMLVDQVVIRRP